MPKPTAAPEGVTWPVSGDGGARGTTPTAKQILAASLRPEPKAVLLGEPAKKWRHGYVKHFEAAVGGLATSTADAQSLAAAGLDAAYEAFEFHREGQVHPLPVAMDGKTYPGTFETGSVKGAGSTARSWGIPYTGPNGLGKASYGPADTARLLQHWAEYGTVAPSVAGQLQRLAEHEEWLDLTGRVFVLIGATSEMGPLEFLLAHNATVVGIARPSGKWRKLLETARGLAGEFVYPVAAGCDGADALTQTPELATWLSGLFPKQDLTVCCYIYQDGEAFVRASVAMDAIVRALGTRRASPPQLAFIDTPTHVHHLKGGREEQLSAVLRKAAPCWQRALGQASGSLLQPTVFTPLAAGKDGACLLRAVSTMQGPNYALAKLVQRWRAIAARGAGQLVSINVGPGARTASVMHAAQVGAAANNLHHFKPNEFYDPETVSAVMALLLICDLRDPTALAQPGVALAHPLDLIQDNAWHGGAWTSAFSLDSMGAVAYVLYLLKRHAIWLAPLTLGGLLWLGASATGIKVM
jgi:hypothetical protein